MKVKKSKKKHKSRSRPQQTTPPTNITAPPSQSVPGDFIELNSIGRSHPHTPTPSLTCPRTPSGLTTDVVEATPSPHRPEAIDNATLCIPEPTGSKKLPSLTNEGTHKHTPHTLTPLTPPPIQVVV